MDNYQFATAESDKKHVDVEGDGEGDVLLLLKEEEQEKQKDGGESLTMPADVASMKRKRGDEDDQDVGGDDDEAEAEDKGDEAEDEDDEDDESDVDDDDAAKDRHRVAFDPSKEEDESVQKYYEQLNKSEGFDFDEFPAVSYMDMPFEAVCHVDLEYEKSIVTRLTEEALDDYNGKHNTSYLFDSVEKANCSAIGELFVYYITFKANNVTSVAPETFQAKVKRDLGIEFDKDDMPIPVVKVKFCRLKRT